MLSRWGRGLHAARPQSVGGGTWGRGQVGGGAGARAEHGFPGPERGASLGSCPLAGCSSQPWLCVAGPGGTGRRGVGPGRLPPGGPRVGAGHLPLGLNVRAGRPASAKCGGRSGAGAGLERGERGPGAKPEGFSPTDEIGMVYGGRWGPVRSDVCQQR